MELKKQALISDLIVMARADGKVADAEYEFVLRLADRMGFHKREVDALFENPQPSQPLFSELERITHFYKLILLMYVDNEIHEQEVITARNFGLKMGIRQGVLDQIINRVVNYEDGIIPSEELMKIFKTYYN
ncbi:TerB family tellurite resistance protein [Jejudonia soesokkakensis]|uniref:TerB family tellurite resistance protein n=1 Tax=Jejudonia soesokkakensis TaxID=1323432 RepID=A0ABW2MTD9_9FLAO